MFRKHFSFGAISGGYTAVLTTSDAPWRLSFRFPPTEKMSGAALLHLIVCTDVKRVVSRAVWANHVAEGTGVVLLCPLVWPET